MGFNSGFKGLNILSASKWWDILIRDSDVFAYMLKNCGTDKYKDITGEERWMYIDDNYIDSTHLVPLIWWWKC